MLEALILVGAFLVALVLLANGLSMFSSANYLQDPVHAFENQASGLIQIGIGSTVLLVLIGGITGVYVLLCVLFKAAKKSMVRRNINTLLPFITLHSGLRRESK